MNSIWTNNEKKENFEQLKTDIKTEVLIIGGGITGILCAYFLKNAGVDYVLVEGKQTGHGITKNTTAKITSQHGLIYDKLLHDKGSEKAKIYLDANQAAIQIFNSLCSKFSCDFEMKPAYIYSRTNQNVIEREIDAVNKLGLRAEFVSSLPLPIKIAGAIKFDHQAQFHPLKFINELSKELRIYENTFVTSLNDNTAVTEHGKITAKHIFVTTHFPFINTHGSYFLKLYQHRSYAIAIENAENINGMYLEETKNGMSFRNYQNLLIIGGGDHRTGKGEKMNFSGEKKSVNWNPLREFAKRSYPGHIEKNAWATQDCMSLDGIPYIGHYGKSTKYLYVATGFNKWGMTSAMVSAMILTDMVLGKINPYAEVFSPHRSMLTPQLFINGFEAVANLLSFSKKRCPHLGCALKWNKAEHSWDCPCHGSRFEENGTLIDNPATGNLTN